MSRWINKLGYVGFIGLLGLLGAPYLFGFYGFFGFFALGRVDPQKKNRFDEKYERLMQ